MIRDNVSASTAPSLATRALRKLWVTTRGERSWVRRYGTLREKERLGVLHRPNYAYGLLRAADLAKYFGKKAVTICEFGVASGDGLVNMADLAELIGAEVGVEFRTFGFDTGAGLPELVGHKDHPEIWSGGDFIMHDQETLRGRLEGRARLVLGDIADTVDEFTQSLDPEAPLGFVSIDVDIYSATRSALRCFNGSPEQYLPAVSCYFDDVSFFFANEWCGELAAIREFNDEREQRKLGHDRSVSNRKLLTGQTWCEHMYVAHVLDHPARQRPAARSDLDIPAHHAFMKANNLY